MHATNLTEQGLQVGDRIHSVPGQDLGRRQQGFVRWKDSRRPRRSRSGRVIVNDDLTIPGHPEVQVIGDLANFPHQDGKPLPGVSPVAMQQGRHAARNILAMIDGRKATAFLVLGQGQHGHDRAKQSRRRPAFRSFQRISGVDGVAICPRAVSGRIPQSHSGVAPMGLGVFHFQQRRSPHHTEFPIRNKAAGVRRIW